jgi:hypothetical protein
MIEVLKQLVDALETYGDKHRKTYLLEGAWDEEIIKADAAIKAVKKAIAELESQEPVAWMDADGNVSDNNDHKCFPIPLYTTTPQRTWVGLTNNELQPIADEYRILFGSWVEDFARAIEAKLKEKNT